MGESRHRTPCRKTCPRRRKKRQPVRLPRRKSLKFGSFVVLELPAFAVAGFDSGLNPHLVLPPRKARTSQGNAFHPKCRRFPAGRQALDCEYIGNTLWAGTHEKSSLG